MSYSSSEVHENLHSVISKLVKNKDKYDRQFYEIILANGIFVRKGFPIKDTYLAAAKKYYDSLAKNLDFVEKSQESTESTSE